MYTIGSQRIYLELLLFAVIALSLMTYSFYFTNRIINTSGPLIEATEKIILETTLAHLRFEEVLSGDRHEDMNVVWRHLERADWYVQTILQGGENTTTTILPLENPLLRQQFREVLDKIATFRKVTEERFKLHTSKAPLTDITQRYHAVFSGFLAFADKVEEHVFEFTSKEIMVCRFVQWILVFIILFLFVMAGKIFIYHHRHQGEYTRLLEKEITERRRGENKIKQAYLEQQALAEIMRISLQPLTLQEMLEGALDVLLSSPLLKLEKKGSIFLARDGEDMLGLAVQNGFPSHLQVSCNILPFGRCLCGRAAENREIIFSSHLDERHEITYEGMQPHGHYCVPILTGTIIYSGY